MQVKLKILLIQKKMKTFSILSASYFAKIKVQTLWTNSYWQGILTCVIGHKRSKGWVQTQPSSETQGFVSRFLVRVKGLFCWSLRMNLVVLWTMLRSPHILILSNIVSAVLSLIETKNSWSYRVQRDKTYDWNWIWEKKSFIWILNFLEGIRGDSTINIHVATANACTSFPVCARGTTLSFRIKARFVLPRNGSRDIDLLLSGMHSK